MKKQTAVEWFFNQLIDKKNQTPEILWAAYLNAKAIEKEQIVDAWMSEMQGIAYRTAGEKYYNETYK